MGKLTLWGMYQYDPTLFDNVVLPEGYKKNDLVNKIMRTVGALYPYHQVPPQLKVNITSWFSTRFYDFEQMYKAYTASYNPIENYDRHEKGQMQHQEKGNDIDKNELGSKDTTTYGRKDTTAYGRKDDYTHGLKQTVIPDTTSISQTDVSAFDSNVFQPRSKETVTNTGTTESTNSGTDSNAASGTDTVQFSGDDIVARSGTDTRTTTYGHGYDDEDERHVHGNIGVTTNQQMISAELEMRIQYDLYAVICSLFEDEFLISVY